MYLASQLDKTTISWHFELQLITAFPMLKMYPAVKHLVAMSPAQSESVYPDNRVNMPW